jgi:hypothetical protein
VEGAPGNRSIDGVVDLQLSEVLSGLSHALDITEGQVPGHAERSCLIGMRIAAELDLDDDARSSLFYALLEIMRRDANRGLDGNALAALEQVLPAR